MKKFRRQKGGEYSASLEYAKPKKKISKQMIWGLFIIAIMALSVIGYVSTDFFGGEKYNGFDIEPTAEGNWVVDVAGKDVVFYSHPGDAALIEDTDNAVRIIRNARVIYVTSDPNDEFKDAIGKVEYELIENAAGNTGIGGIDIVYSFTKNNTFSKPIVDCANASVYLPVIKFKKSQETKLKVQNSCIIVEASSPYAFLRIRDRILYGFYGVIE